jgi:hypothetical protein
MPSLKAIRKRIVSVKNTRKITKAMKLVAAAKLRRAQETIIAARPYSSALSSVVSELSGVAGKDAHPLFEEREGKRAAIVVITADRGLAGAFNTNVIKAVERYSANELSGASDITLRIIGKKANQHFSRRNANIASYDPAPTSATARSTASSSRTTSSRTRAPRSFASPRSCRSHRVPRRKPPSSKVTRRRRRRRPITSTSRTSKSFSTGSFLSTCKSRSIARRSSPSLHSSAPR